MLSAGWELEISGRNSGYEKLKDARQNTGRQSAKVVKSPALLGFFRTPGKKRKPTIVSIIGFLYGGPERDRTVDLSDANRTLSQLSYRPM
jgi:hypothetical protein